VEYFAVPGIIPRTFAETTAFLALGNRLAGGEPFALIRLGMHKSRIVLVALAWVASVVFVSAQKIHPSLIRNHPAIAYATAPVSDPIARLNDRLQRGEIALEKSGPSGYLSSVLSALEVPIDSQVLVFSKTSFQAPRINPTNPRAIFFNDTVAVGWVRGGPVLEFVAHDPKQGAIFYTLEQAASGTPRFERNDTCVMCHASDATHNVPGMFVGSVFPSPEGTTMYGPAYTTDHRSPFELRWGGWFVAGTHHASRHMGNAIATDPSDLAAMVKPETVHVTGLDGRFDMTGYLSPQSDIVALLVLEHQAQMLNLITRVGWEVRVGADAQRTFNATVEDLVDYLLFVDESPLPGPIAGPTTFSRTFSSGGPRDARGRSLRDLDLTRRLLKYPCSYLIYSEPFDGLPESAKSAVYQRMWNVLNGQVAGDRYRPLSVDDRTAIIEILRETKKDLPPYWMAVRGE
jgi:hypothetical protein